jgi:hypothetical protein
MVAWSTFGALSMPSAKFWMFWSDREEQARGSQIDVQAAE